MPTPDILCVYYPHWHRYPKGDEWFSDRYDWSEGEWCFVKDAKPLFPGHKQPLVPTCGYLKGDDPADVAKEIDLAADAGIDCFVYDYYWYDGKVTQEEAVEKGFLKAPNRNRMKFALMWCYHERNDQFRPAPDEPRRRLMSLANTKEEFLGLIKHSLEKYFPCPEYYRKDGRLYFSIFAADTFVNRRGREAKRIRAELDEARELVRAAGLGELHINGQNPRNLDDAILFAECGFDSITDYNLVFGAKIVDGVGEYADTFACTRARWSEMAKAPIPYIPQVTTGWDSTPRCRYEEGFPWRSNNYPYGFTLKNNTPELFGQLLSDAIARVTADPKNPGAVYINGWNEYTEGTYLVPNNFDGDGFLRTIHDVVNVQCGRK